jgi:hypothetical protein
LKVFPHSINFIFGLCYARFRERELSKAYPEIDLVTTPDGKIVEMVHSNNCTSDYDAWINLFGEAVKVLGNEVSKSDLYDKLLGMLAYGYISGEHITHFGEGRPLVNVPVL